MKVQRGPRGDWPRRLAQSGFMSAVLLGAAPGGPEDGSQKDDRKSAHYQSRHAVLLTGPCRSVAFRIPDSVAIGGHGGVRIGGGQAGATRGVGGACSSQERRRGYGVVSRARGQSKWRVCSAMAMVAEEAPSTSPSASTSRGGSYKVSSRGRQTMRRTRS